MHNRHKKPVIGLLGGICSGKSTVAAEFAKLDCAVIDADKLAKGILDTPPIKQMIAERFGTSILAPDGSIDRKALAKVVFADSNQLDILNKIVHPSVLKQTQALRETYRNQQQIKAIVLDVPLLAEVGWEKQCDYLVFIETSDEIRMERAKKRGISPEELKIRENFQISLDKKASIADYIVNNNSDHSELGEQVSRIFRSILEKNAQY